jgi:hypothetical protein
MDNRIAAPVGQIERRLQRGVGGDGPQRHRHGGRIAGDPQHQRAVRLQIGEVFDKVAKIIKTVA